MTSASPKDIPKEPLLSFPKCLPTHVFHVRLFIIHLSGWHLTRPTSIYYKEINEHLGFDIKDLPLPRTEGCSDQVTHTIPVEDSWHACTYNYVYVFVYTHDMGTHRSHHQKKTSCGESKYSGATRASETTFTLRWNGWNLKWLKLSPFLKQTAVKVWPARSALDDDKFHRPHGATAKQLQPPTPSDWFRQPQLRAPSPLDWLDQETLDESLKFSPQTGCLEDTENRS